MVNAVCQVIVFVIFSTLVYNAVSLDYSPKVMPSPISRVSIFKSQNDLAYYGIFDVGTPPQKLRLILDSELDFTIFLNVKSCPLSFAPHCFNTSASTSYINTGEIIRRSCIIGDDELGFEGLNYTQNTRFCLANYEVNWDMYEVDGYFGIGYTNDNTLSEFYHWQRVLPPDWPNIYALKLRGNHDSEMHFGGYDYQEQLVWSEKQTNVKTQTPSFVEASFFHLSICGGELSPSTAFIAADIVTSHYCLGLPTEVFNNVVSWLQCDEAEETTINSGQISCKFSNSSDIQKLPSLQFQLSDSSPTFTLPLSRLVTSTIVHSKYTLATLCIVRSVTISEAHKNEKIVFGILPSESFYIVTDMDNNRVAFHQYEQDANSRCPKRKDCSQGQSYNPSSNSCDAPPCDDYFFQYVDENYKCRTSKVFIGLVVGTILLLGSLELIVTEVRLSLERRALRGAHAE